MNGIKIQIRGLVQGVGFRPFISRLAAQLSIRGNVSNDGKGVVIYAWGSAEILDQFTQDISRLAPVSSRIDFVDSELLNHSEPFPTDFQIVQSKSCVQLSVQPPADAAICKKCLDDLRNERSRFYHYPFVSCSECGPRYTIIKNLPYDRDNTSMGDFNLCAQCWSDYINPNDRRFHAQTLACSKCGPKLWLESVKTHTRYSGLGDSQTLLSMVAKRLKDGEIVAIKATGGYRLVCDATNNQAIEKLRIAKHRTHKPFALMAKNIDQIRRFVTVSERESEELLSAANPIVVLSERKPNFLPDALAPNQDTLGFMLTGTALEAMLFDFIDVPLVMTSGNLSGEPICSTNQLARDKLSSVADCFLMNDRDIVHRVDDSVVAFRKQRYVYRRARGLAADVFELPFSIDPDLCLLAMGGNKKSTFSVLSGSQVYLSRDFGDLEDYDACLEYQSEIQAYLSLQGLAPDRIVIDRHNGYASSKHGNSLSEVYSSPLCKVQHHHAHIVAVMLEHSLPINKNVIGLCLDGLGLGDGEQLWGAEILDCTYRQYERHACLPMVPMPGGDRASKEPLRNLIAHLVLAGVYDTITSNQVSNTGFSYLVSERAKQFCQMIDKQFNSPYASSMGRLFDAVAAALDICRYQQSYEGQAGSELESLANPSINKPFDLYSLHFTSNTNSGLSAFWLALFDDIASSLSTQDISAKFHLSLVDSLHKVVAGRVKAAKTDTVVFAGGVFQNRILCDLLSESLQRDGLTVLLPKSVPANDAAIALGQATIAAANLASVENLVGENGISDKECPVLESSPS